jgi:bis(5'-nucleosyl)-tetraphosphatase (symmetrical)
VQHVFVGDVQGCGLELEQLLSSLRSQFGDEYGLWTVGDVVNRGPCNLHALRQVRELVDSGRGHYVLGNHEIALIAIGLGLRSPEPEDTIGDVLESPEAEDWVEWLRRRPLVESGRLADEGVDSSALQDFAMVHASVHPDWGLAELLMWARRIEARLGAADRDEARALLSADPARDPDLDVLARLTCCRSVSREDGGARWCSQPPGVAFDAWHEQWALRGHSYGVVYGHWALQGLHVAPGLRGLDTGCVHNGCGGDGCLTAWLPGHRQAEERSGVAGPAAAALAPFAVPDDRFWRVPALAEYFRERHPG